MPCRFEASGAPLHRKSSPSVYTDTRAIASANGQNRMIPRFSGIHHLFDTHAKTYLPVCGGPAAQDADAISTFSSPVYSPHPRKRTPQTAKYTPGTVSNAPECGYSFSILFIYSPISDSKSVNPISRTTTSQYPDRSFRKSRTREPTLCRNSRYRFLSTTNMKS